MKNLDTVAALLGEKGRFVFTSHKGLDADGFGSELALSRFLRTRGKEVVLLNCDPPPRECRFLVAPDDPIQVYDPAASPALLNAADAIVLFDVSNFGRLADMADPIARSPALKVRIDHHPQEVGFEDITLAEETASATGEIVFRLIKEMGGTLDQAIAAPLYASVIADTGMFKFSRTHPGTHQAAAEMLATGIDHQFISESVFERLESERVRVMGSVLRDLETDCDGRLLWFTVTQRLLEEMGAGPEAGADMANHTLLVGSVEIGLVFRELPGGGTKVSLRSRGNYPVNTLAGKFGGGGHAFAAGIEREEPLPVLQPQVLDAARALLSA